MSCIHEAYNLGAAPALYLYSKQKETNRISSMLKTAAALVLLVPGALLALGSLALNILLSSCISLRPKVTPKEITDASKDRSVEKPKQSDENPLLANLSSEDLKRWERDLSTLEENIKIFRSQESLIIHFFCTRSKNLDHPKIKTWWKDPHKYISQTPFNDKKLKSFGIIHEKYSQFPECLKPYLHTMQTLEKSQSERILVAKTMSEDRERFETLFIAALSSCRHTCSQYLDLYDQKGLQHLDRLQKKYYESAAIIWRKLRRLYSIEKNELLKTRCDMRIEASQRFLNFLHTKIEKHLKECC